jgi:hypothetical protein
MSNEPKKPEELTPDELDGVSGGTVNPGPPNVRPGLHISPVLADPPDPDRIAVPPGPCKIG